MQKAWEFGTAVEFLNTWRGKDSVVAGVDDDYYSAEEFLLAARPRTALEAASLIEIIRENLEGGPRTDGLDLAALDNLHDWVIAQACRSKPRRPTPNWILPSYLPFQRARRDGG